MLGANGRTKSAGAGMSADQATSTRSRWIRVLRWFLPADADTVYACVAVLLALIGAGLIGGAELGGIQLGQASASWHFRAAILLPTGIVFLFFVRYCLVVLRRKQWSWKSCNWRFSLVLGVFSFCGGVADFLNRELDRAPARKVAVTVSDQFVLYYHRKGDDRHVEHRSFVALDVPEPIARFRLVYDIAGDVPGLARTRPLERHERFDVPGHPGWLGMPWYEFKAARRLIRRLGIPAGVGRLADALCYDKKTFKREVANGNLVFVKAEGCFTPDSPSRRQLQRWGVRIVEPDNCPP